MIRAGSILTAVVALVLVPAAAHSFPWFSDPYTGSGSSCGGAVDPINLVWKGTNAWADDVARNIEVHAGWTDTSGSTQSIHVPSGGGCRSMDRQRASAGSTSTRYHIRLWRVTGTDGADKLVIGDAHHEDFVWYCGHAVDSNGSNGSGFDQGRRRLVDAFSTHYEEGNWWGNTRNFQQCDGDWAGSDGIGVKIGNDHRH